MSISAAALALSESVAEKGDPPIGHYTVGAIALGILIVLMLILLAFGGGREHS
jgi:hypothetical protein